MDLFLQCANGTRKDSFHRLQCSKLLSIYNARIFMVAGNTSYILLYNSKNPFCGSHFHSFMIKKKSQVVPRWHEHWTSNKVYDGDMIVLQGQEKVFLSKSMDGSTDVNQQYTKLTFTPTQADRFVLAFRNWLRRHGNSQPEWFGQANVQSLPSTYLSKRQVLKLGAFGIQDSIE